MPFSVFLFNSWGVLPSQRPSGQAARSPRACLLPLEFVFSIIARRVHSIAICSLIFVDFFCHSKQNLKCQAYWIRNDGTGIPAGRYYQCIHHTVCTYHVFECCWRNDQYISIVCLEIPRETFRARRRRNDSASYVRIEYIIEGVVG